ncbi:hypothetical protein RHSIM_Rhsim03G0232700 [Rhododendron simsii]|uniref:Uncharacterized protein n=1 Tax=Rhododendron simsii TaxID=118357 RepID=A0A834LSN2_RHOSS|nr:hypothetical protein RHSIM_Rhsim03G0232700 [Rhododendron simsii]
MEGSLARRYKKVVWRTLVISNLALGGDSWQKAYMLSRASKKDTASEKRKPRAKQPSTPVATTATSVPEEPFFSPPIIEPVSDSS